MLRRAEELKAIIENRTPPEQPEEWDALTETPEALLVAEADKTGGASRASNSRQTGDSGDANAGRLARRVLAERLVAIAEDLASTATVDPPDSITLAQRSGDIRITKAGPNAGDVQKAQQKVAAEHPSIVMMDPATWILGATGLVLVVLAFFLPLGWLVLLVVVGLGLLIGAAARSVRRKRMRASQEDSRQRAVADVERRAGLSHQNYLSAVETLQATVAKAAEDNRAIKAALNT